MPPCRPNRPPSNPPPSAQLRNSDSVHKFRKVSIFANGGQGRSSGMKWPKAGQTIVPELIVATPLDRVQRLLPAQIIVPGDASLVVAIFPAPLDTWQFRRSF